MRNNRILVISDLHIPYNHQDAIPFLTKIKKRLAPTRIICIGDETDKHSMSYHEKDPELASAGDEHWAAIQLIRELYRVFPLMDVLNSNHGSLVQRKARTAGIPGFYLRNNAEVLETPGWTWHDRLELVLPTGVHCVFQHQGGANVLNASREAGSCFVQGHYHSKMCIQYWKNSRGHYWGMVVGCLVDDGSLAMAYNKTVIKRPVLGCGFILEGVPFLIPMFLDKGGRWTGSV